VPADPMTRFIELVSRAQSNKNDPAARERFMRSLHQQEALQ
jgi:hypothetical protein